jgi:hypothetical protein
VHLPFCWSNTEEVALVRMEGVEPTRLAALDPKSSASANFATSAFGVANVGQMHIKRGLFAKVFWQKAIWVTSSRPLIKHSCVAQFDICFSSRKRVLFPITESKSIAAMLQNHEETRKLASGFAFNTAKNQ